MFIKTILALTLAFALAAYSPVQGLEEGNVVREGGAKRSPHWHGSRGRVTPPVAGRGRVTPPVAGRGRITPPVVG